MWFSCRSMSEPPAITGSAFGAGVKAFGAGVKAFGAGVKAFGAGVKAFETIDRRSPADDGVGILRRPAVRSGGGVGRPAPSACSSK
jgi:hypothetical protein